MKVSAQLHPTAVSGHAAREATWSAMEALVPPAGMVAFASTTAAVLASCCPHSASRWGTTTSGAVAAALSVTARLAFAASGTAALSGARTVTAGVAAGPPPLRLCKPSPSPIASVAISASASAKRQRCWRPRPPPPPPPPLAIGRLKGRRTLLVMSGSPRLLLVMSFAPPMIMPPAAGMAGGKVMGGATPGCSGMPLSSSACPSSFVPRRKGRPVAGFMSGTDGLYSAAALPSGAGALLLPGSARRPVRGSYAGRCCMAFAFFARRTLLRPESGDCAPSLLALRPNSFGMAEEEEEQRAGDGGEGEEEQ